MRHTGTTNLTCTDSADDAWAGRLEVFDSSNYLKHCDPGSSYHRLQMGCVATNANSSWFYLYPPKHLTVYMWSFSFASLSFALNPVALQRMFLGRSDRDAATALSLVHAYPVGSPETARKSPKVIISASILLLFMQFDAFCSPA